MQGSYKNARAFARDLGRNNALAAAAKDTLVQNAVNIGLSLNSQIDYEYLGISKEQAQLKQKELERLFVLWANDPRCDIEGHQTFAELQALVVGSTWESGEVFGGLPIVNSNALVSRLRVQLIEADRVSDPDEGLRQAKPNLWEGIEVDDNGAAERFWVKYTKFSEHGNPESWKPVVPFARSTGSRQFLHLFHKKRPGQPRGMTALAPVIEDLKQLGDYKDYELKAALLASLFTVFIESQGADIPGDIDSITEDNFTEVQIGAANIVGLAPGEKISTAAPGRPNAEFETFFSAITAEIGSGLGIPYELLTKRFQASYSASRAALLEAWKSFRMHRHWLSNHFCQPVYTRFVDDLVARGVVDLPGYFNDPVTKAAWLKSEWIGVPREEIDPLKPAQADLIHVNLGTKSRDKVIRESSNSDFQTVHAQIKEEFDVREADGLNDLANSQNGELDTTPDDVTQHNKLTIEQLKKLIIVDENGKELDINLVG
jgi:lambda family phage portal protein